MTCRVMYNKKRVEVEKSCRQEKLGCIIKMLLIACFILPALNSPFHKHLMNKVQAWTSKVSEYYPVHFRGIQIMIKMEVSQCCHSSPLLPFRHLAQSWFAKPWAESRKLSLNGSGFHSEACRSHGWRCPASRPVGPKTMDLNICAFPGTECHR